MNAMAAPASSEPANRAATPPTPRTPTPAAVSRAQATRMRSIGRRWARRGATGASAPSRTTGRVVISPATAPERPRSWRMSVTSGGRLAKTVRRLMASRKISPAMRATGRLTAERFAPDEATRTSASIRAAVASSGGSRSRRIDSIEERLACAERFTAATTFPPRRASARRPSAGPPRAPGRRSPSPGRGRGQLVAQRRVDVTVRGESRWSSALREVGVELALGQPGEQHAAHRRGVGGEARADIDGDGHDARRGTRADVDDVRAVEHGHRGRLVHLGDERARGAARPPRAGSGWTGRRSRARARAG